MGRQTTPPPAAVFRHTFLDSEARTVAGPGRRNPRPPTPNLNSRIISREMRASARVYLTDSSSSARDSVARDSVPSGFHSDAHRVRTLPPAACAAAAFPGPRPFASASGSIPWIDSETRPAVPVLWRHRLGVGDDGPHCQRLRVCEVGRACTTVAPASLHGAVYDSSHHHAT